jgi:hypothetical protein|tara:strand:- start:3367 stop:3999 length:633 start_codon:yes stop_codon:yes gene_type:complete
MASLLLLMCCCSSLSSSAAGGFITGFIPGTSPHFEKVVRMKKMRQFMDLANELRLIGTDIPREGELPGDLTTKNAMLDSFRKLQEKSPELCTLYNELTSEDARAEIKKGMQYYKSNESILTFSGFQDWKSYLKDMMEPTEEMKVDYGRLTEDQVRNSCTWQSQDEERKKCLPFSNVDIAIMEMKDSCESLRDMMEQQPEDLVDQILNAKQ